MVWLAIALVVLASLALEQGGRWHSVWGTSFGPQGTTDPGPRGDRKYLEGDVLVGLPSYNALGRTVLIRRPKNGGTVEAYVQDGGPWYLYDEEYVFDGARPLAELANAARPKLYTEIGANRHYWTTEEVLECARTDGSEAARRLLHQRDAMGAPRAAKYPRHWKRLAKQNGAIDLSWAAWIALGVDPAKAPNWSEELEWKFI